MRAAVAPHSHQLAAADGTVLHVTDYMLPMQSMRGSVVIMHGLGEHSGRYRQLAQFFNDCGLAVRCYDHRGHGRSGGDRGDVINGDPLVQDAEIVIDDFAARFSRPPFLFGHSMGGLFAARFALARLSPLRGLILSSPALGVRLSGLQANLLRCMYKVLPWLAVPTGLPPRYLSHDPGVVAAYKADPLVHGRISARLMHSMLRAIDDCRADAATLSIPTLMQVAGDDRIVDAEGSRHFHAQLTPGLACLHVYDQFYHEVFNEIARERPYADLRSWLDTQSAL